MLSATIRFESERRDSMDTSTAAAKRPRIRRNREQWRELLERFDHSGQSREQFCHEQGLTLSSFAYWRRALGKTAARRGDIAGDPLFVEWTPPARAGAGGWDVELQLGDGLVLRLRRPC
jgi:hypothetical protein